MSLFPPSITFPSAFQPIRFLSFAHSQCVLLRSEIPRLCVCLGGFSRLSPSWSPTRGYSCYIQPGLDLVRNASLSFQSRLFMDSKLWMCSVALVPCLSSRGAALMLVVQGPRSALMSFWPLQFPPRWLHRTLLLWEQGWFV